MNECLEHMGAGIRDLEIGEVKKKEIVKTNPGALGCEEKYACILGDLKLQLGQIHLEICLNMQLLGPCFKDSGLGVLGICILNELPR